MVGQPRTTSGVSSPLGIVSASVFVCSDGRWIGKIVVKFGENADFGAKCTRTCPGSGNFAVLKSRRA